MTRYAEHVSTRKTSQREPARVDQVQNSAGGYVFAVDCWTRLDRFLTLGAEGGTYYVGEKELTRENAKCIDACAAADFTRTVNRVVEISDSGRAPKNDPAIFALAILASNPDPAKRAIALAVLPKVCRIGTHLFHFVQSCKSFRGWSRGLRRAIAGWYNHRPAEKLALQLTKYQQRDGWANRDLLRLSHARGLSPAHNACYRWATQTLGGMGGRESRMVNGVAQPAKGSSRALDSVPVELLPRKIMAFEEIHSAGVSVERACKIIIADELPHECAPNEFKSKPEIWEAMLPSMGITAVIRNLGKMTSVGLIKPMSPVARSVASKLTDPKTLFAGRVHPISILLALKTYASGHGFKGSLSWTPVREIVDALDEAFYLSFAAIEPTGKRFMLALDVSGSMDAAISGTRLSCREASCAMAMATARSERDWYLTGFTASGRGYGGHWGGDPSALTPIPISNRSRLDDAVAACASLRMGGTDCALPMLHATAQKLEVDTFVVYTDNETWAGAVHPFQALKEYRQKSGIPAKLVVVGMTATEFSIADPSDSGMLDVAGFDAAVPAVIADFAADRSFELEGNL